MHAHHHPRSFCHGVLEWFTDGLQAAGHTSGASHPGNAQAVIPGGLDAESGAANHVEESVSAALGHLRDVASSRDDDGPVASQDQTV